MTWREFAEVTTLSAVVGIAAYCFACALHMWRGRNAASNRSTSRDGVVRPLIRGSVVLVACGMLGMVAASIWLAAVRREGVLSTEGVFTVRAPEDLDVASVTNQTSIEQGMKLASFHSPEQAAKIRQLELRKTKLQAEREVLVHTLLPVDPEIGRKLAETNTRERSLHSLLMDLLLEKTRLSRESLRERADKQNEIDKLQLTTARLKEELKQAQADLQLARDGHERHVSLLPHGAATEEQLVRKANELKSTEIEVRKLKTQLSKATEQRARWEDALANALKVADRHNREIEGEIERVQRQLNETARNEKSLHQERANDMVRAQRQREQNLKKLAIEQAMAEALLKEQKAIQSVAAPFGGQIVYRAASPGNVQPQDPVVVLSPPNGFHLTVRVPSWMKSSLKATETLTCELLQDLERDEQKRFVESRFPATFVGSKQLAADPDFILARLNCDLPGEAIHQLALGEQIAARLVWRPPLYTVPWFMVSAILVVLGAGTWTALLFVARPKESAQSSLADTSVTSRPTTQDLSTEFGAEGVMLQMLGSQLREMIARNEPDPQLIATAEWAIDRHGSRATRFIARGLGDSGPLLEHLHHFAKEASQTEYATSENGGASSIRLLRRLIALVKTAYPNLDPHQMALIERQLSLAGLPESIRPLQPTDDAGN